MKSRCHGIFLERFLGWNSKTILVGFGELTHYPSQGKTVDFSSIHVKHRFFIGCVGPLPTFFQKPNLSDIFSCAQKCQRFLFVVGEDEVRFNVGSRDCGPLGVPEPIFGDLLGGWWHVFCSTNSMKNEFPNQKIR